MNTPAPSAPNSAQSLLSIECTECAAPVPITRQPLCGEVLRCGACHTELEIVSVEPLRLEIAPEVEEDWGE